MSQDNLETKKNVSMHDEYTKAMKFIGEDEYSPQEFAALSDIYSKSFKDVKEGEIIQGEIVRIQDDHVIVNIGFKSAGTVVKDEFYNFSELQVGQKIDVVLESVEDQNGELVLSKRRADFLKIWEKVLRAHETQEILPGKIIKRIKGGMVVDLMGMEAFLPGSQIDIRPIRDFDNYVGQEMDFKVVKVNIPTENVVVSHKVLIEEELSDQRKAILEKLERGQILEGVVKAITDFGVFVDLGGVDGLVHITDLSWGRINHPTEVVKLDQIINVVVTDFDEEKRRISLSLKKLLPHPWDSIEEKYNINQKVSGRVVSLTDYGAFIEIEKGIEGLIHNSEMSWTQHIKHPSQVVAMGQIVDAVILSLDKEEKKISLGMKQLEPDPWHELMQKYPVDSRHVGVARNLTNFGAFVELEPGIDGLVHISDLSWTKKIRHPGEVVKKNDKIEVIVLAVDVEQRKISLGHKQILDNPWDTFEDVFAVGKEYEGVIGRIIDKGIIVELPQNVDGFVPTSQLSTAKIKNLAMHFPIGEKIVLRVIEFDKESKKIVLSAIVAMKEKDDETIANYISKHKLEKASVEDIKNYEVGVFEPIDFPNFEIGEKPSRSSEETAQPAASENANESTSDDSNDAFDLK